MCGYRDLERAAAPMPRFQCDSGTAPELTSHSAAGDDRTASSAQGEDLAGQTGYVAASAAAAAVATPAVNPLDLDDLDDLELNAHRLTTAAAQRACGSCSATARCRSPLPVVTVGPAETARVETAH